MTCFSCLFPFRDFICNSINWASEQAIQNVPSYTVGGNQYRGFSEKQKQNYLPYNPAIPFPLLQIRVPVCYLQHIIRLTDIKTCGCQGEWRWGSDGLGVWDSRCKLLNKEKQEFTLQQRAYNQYSIINHNRKECACVHI